MESNNKYSKGKIYRLINSLTEETIYIGSTVDKLCKRMTGHRTACKKNKTQVYKFINEFIFIENIKIILIEKYPCDSFDELRMREQYYIEQFKEQIKNTMNAFTSQETKKEQAKINNKLYVQKNKKKFKCELCDFYAYNIKDLKKHFGTKIHLEKINNLNSNYKNNCESCNFHSNLDWDYKLHL